MLSQTVSRELLAEGLFCTAAAEAGHRWVLAAMQSHGPALLTMLWRMLGNEQDVCDAYQSTFLHLAHAQAGKGPRNVRAYVFRTAANFAITSMRSRAAERRTVAAATSRQQAVVRCPQQELDQEERMQSLRFHLTQLPEHLRQVVILRDLGDLSYGEISRIMGISAASARVYRCKAIQLLAVWMGQEG